MEAVAVLRREAVDGNCWCSSEEASELHRAKQAGECEVLAFDPVEKEFLVEVFGYVHAMTDHILLAVSQSSQTVNLQSAIETTTLGSSGQSGKRAFGLNFRAKNWLKV